MHFDKRFHHSLILLSFFCLTGFELSQCTDSSSADGDSSSGSTGIRIQVRDEQKISADKGNFNGNLTSGDRFGSAVSTPGDLESDGVQDLTVGAPFDDDGGADRGAAWVLFMDGNGRVDNERKISGEAGGFDGNLDNNDFFGSALAGTGDLNGDGAFDLAVGAPGSDVGGPDRGAVWMLFLNAEGRVRDQQRIADDAGGFRGDLGNDDRFGSAIAAVGDINGDGIGDLAVGAPNDDRDSADAGAVWILFMNALGRVDDWQRITEDTGGFGGKLRAGDHFGSAVAAIGDLDRDGIPDLAVGAPGSDEGGTDRGAVWILFLNAEGRVREQQRIADRTGGFSGELDDEDLFGSALAGLGDLNGDGLEELAVGAPNDDDGSANAGALWILFLEADGRVDGWQKVSGKSGGFDGNLDADDHFGAALAGIGNLDNNGIADLAVGAPGDDDGGDNKGALWILFMQRLD
jgi:hypothetical protein